jgi:hypothetical protein
MVDESVLEPPTVRRELGASIAAILPQLGVLAVYAPCC